MQFTFAQWWQPRLLHQKWCSGFRGCHPNRPASIHLVSFPRALTHFTRLLECCFWTFIWSHIFLQKALFSSVQSLSRVRLFATPWIAAPQASLSSPTPGVHWDSCPSSQWCHPAISSSVVPFSSCPQSLPASEGLSRPYFRNGLANA